MEAAVTAGALVPGESLPPVRELAAQLGVNANTVAAAYRLLRDRGTVETRGRAGTRVRERPGTSARQRPYVLPTGTRDLAGGGPDVDLLPQLDPPSRVDVARYRYAVAEPELEEQLRRRLARNLAAPTPDRPAQRLPAQNQGAAGAGDDADFDADVDVETDADARAAALVGRSGLVPVFGALDGIDRLLATHTRPGDKVAVEDPAWGNLLDLLASRGLNALPMRVDDEGPDPDDLHTALAAGARMVLVTTRAQNPYGANVSARRAQRLRAVLAAYPDVLTVDDDHGADLTAAGPHVLSGTTRAWAYLYSASKAYGPDLRIAVLVGDDDSVDRVAGQLKHTARNVPSLMQRLWAAALADPRHDVVVQQAARTYAANRDGLIEDLARHGIAAHGAAGLNVWIPVVDETAAATGLLARGWAVAPGSWFRLHSGPGVRVTISDLHTPEERAAFAVAVAEVVVAGTSAATAAAAVSGVGESVV